MSAVASCLSHSLPSAEPEKIVWSPDREGRPSVLARHTELIKPIQQGRMDCGRTVQMMAEYLTECFRADWSWGSDCAHTYQEITEGTAVQPSRYRSTTTKSSLQMKR